jgi:hypothetical protein
MVSFDDGQQVLHWRGGMWHRISWQEWMGFRELGGAFAPLPYVTAGEHRLWCVSSRMAASTTSSRTAT